MDSPNITQKKAFLKYLQRMDAEDWNYQQNNLREILRDYIIPNLEFYETQRKK